MEKTLNVTKPHQSLSYRLVPDPSEVFSQSLIVQAIIMMNLTAIQPKLFGKLYLPFLIFWMVLRHCVDLKLTPHDVTFMLFIRFQTIAAVKPHQWYTQQAERSVALAEPEL